ncbi:MAG: nickel transporter permease NikC [Methanocella sp. PtaU1.Bin125]|nr:MAG: nickel transporter permease NikC [Methanocella sp. PtaU1.Bin125]
MALKFKHPGIVICLAVLLFLAFLAVFAGFIAPYNPEKADLAHRLQYPGADHPFGTDHMGRDILSRVIYGTRISLAIGLIVVAVSAVIGGTMGLVSGYFGGLVDEVIMRVVDAFLAFPGTLLALGIAGLFGTGFVNLLLALVVVEWSSFARLVRAEVLAVRERDFIKASTGLGAGNAYVMVRHVLPNVISPLIVIATTGIGSVILWAAGLSFLGLGIQPPTPEWGYMLNDGRLYIYTAPYIMLFPGLMIFITVLAFNYMGDGLRDILDPRARKELR